MFAGVCSFLELVFQNPSHDSVIDCIISLSTFQPMPLLSLSPAEELGRYVHQPRPGEEAGHHLCVRHCQTHAEPHTGQLSPELYTL